MDTFLIIVLVLLVLKVTADVWLSWLNRQQVMAEAGDVPEPFRSYIDEDTYDKSVAYTLAKNRVEIMESLYDGLILAMILLCGFLPGLWDLLTGFLGAGVWGQAASLFLAFIVIGLFSLPFEWYRQFRLEEKFGFNKSTLQLWISDKIKGLVIGALIGIPALAFIVWIVGLTQIWWLWGFAVMLIFQLIMVVVYPMFILPLFNKFEELPEGSLRERLMELGDRTGFKARTILVMDGSKRSAHSNAYFTGFGRFRRIVLYDTLVEQMTERQLESVLAHEIGHYKLGHIPKLLFLSAASLLVSFIVLGWLERSDWFVEAFGFAASGQIGPVILLFGLLAGLVTFWMSPLSNALSRRYEYQADEFATDALDGDSTPILESLRVLSRKNLSNLTPHSAYSAFHYSHPTLLEREQSLRGEAS